jgi:membrane-associated phospholipid phosphatase
LVRSTPGAVESLVESFDELVDSAFAPLRGRIVPDLVASVASALGDHGLIWFLIGLSRTRRPGMRRRVATWAVAYTGMVSPLVNSGLKGIFRRARPERSGRPLPVRVPRTASFPSGHAMAAWCAATVLADGDPWAPAYYSAAAVISSSRIHVQLHHATDVVAGSVIGVLLGIGGRRVLRGMRALGSVLAD